METTETHIQSLVAIQQEAHAAWVAAPEKTRTEKARKSQLEAALSAATAAVALAKRASRPASAVAPVAAALDAAIQRQKEAADQRELERRVALAANRWDAAEEWPRCGQGWPGTPQEREDAALLFEHGASVLGRDEWSE